jgi:hypothetical protein
MSGIEPWQLAVWKQKQSLLGAGKGANRNFDYL